MSSTILFAAALVAVSINADAADNPGGPDFVVEELICGKCRPKLAACGPVATRTLSLDEPIGPA